VNKNVGFGMLSDKTSQTTRRLLKYSVSKAQKGKRIPAAHQATCRPAAAARGGACRPGRGPAGASVAGRQDSQGRCKCTVLLHVSERGTPWHPRVGKIHRNVNPRGSLSQKSKACGDSAGVDPVRPSPAASRRRRPAAQRRRGRGRGPPGAGRSDPDRGSGRLRK